MIRTYLFLFLLLMPFAPNASLKDNPSPYVAMHADDAVKWHTWGKESIELARKENKLLLLSIGYYSCYWCHVMQGENYNDAKNADYINKHFIPVIIDRELEPSLDAQLNAFVENLNGYAGWPLHVFMTPEGYPLAGTVYLPRQRFFQLLKQLGSLWKDQSEYLSEEARNASFMSRQTQKLSLRPVTKKLVQLSEQSFLDEIKESMDEMEGGFGVENKFPLPSVLDALLNISMRKNDTAMKSFLQLTLNNMAYSGLRDPVDGGFFRYTSDPGWQIPHFEKMLYDNAQLASLYLRAGKLLKQPQFIQIGLETITFIKSKMHVSNGAYASALSAVGEHHIEGEFYLWDRAELQKILSTEEYAFARHYWQLDDAPPVEDGYFPIQKAHNDLKQLAPVFRKIKQHRDKRVLPRDDKQITGWNALALEAFIDAAPYDNTLIADAHRLADFLRNQWQEGQMSRSRIDGQRVGEGTLEDYAYTARALYRWAEFQQDKKSLALAEQIANQGWQTFFLATGWQSEAKPLIPYLSTKAMMAGGVLPSPSAVLTSASIHINRRKFAHNIRLALSTGHSLMTSSPFWYPGQLMSLQLWSKLEN